MTTRADRADQMEERASWVLDVVRDMTRAFIPVTIWLLTHKLRLTHAQAEYTVRDLIARGDLAWGPLRDRARTVVMSDVEAGDA